MALPEEYLKMSPEERKSTLTRAIAAYMAAAPENRKEAGRKALTSAEASATPPDGEPSSAIRVWQPFIDGFHIHSLSVPFNGKVMDRSQFMMVLQGRLEELIAADPAAAKWLLTDSPEYNPDLHIIGMSTKPDDWAAQIMMCDQMMILLNKIDFERGEILNMEESELPGLAELLEQI